MNPSKQNNKKIKNAFLLAAGLGTRMGVHTKEVPKPMLKVGGVPLIVYSLYTLKKLGIENVVINTHYKAEQIKKLLIANSNKIPFNISLSHENQLLGTAGGIKKAIVEKIIPDDQNILLLNTDMIFEPPQGSPLSHPENVLSYLYLKEKGNSNNETGWSINPKNQIQMDIKHGKYYYIGFSIINPLLLEQVKANRVSQLGELWAAASKQNQLMGQSYPARVIPYGNKEQYEAIKDRLPDFLQNDPDFAEFCNLF